MKHAIAGACCALACLTFGTACAKLPPPTEAEKTEAAAAAVNATEEARQAAEALARAQDRVVAHYRRSRMPAAPAAAVERLACLSGNEDRHARIGVELRNGRMNYFAFYSKARPRTCSIEVKRGGPYNRWEDHGATSKVTLVDGKGSFMIDEIGRAHV